MRVLVVDTDARLRRALTYVLLDHGFEVSVTGNAKAALDTLDVVNPDAIVLEADVEGLTAREFLAAQQERAQVAKVPVLVVTSLPRPDLDRFASAGVLMKPFTAEELVTAVRALVGDLAWGPTDEPASPAVPGVPA